jgi:predicted DNA-binding protein (MmcQ/YjbR family)
MELERLRSYLVDKPGTSEETPFGPQALVYKVAGKMFALVAWEAEPLRISLKCDPERALELREVFQAVNGAYHMNKTHWNMVDLDGSVPETEILCWIDDSYDLVVRSLTKRKKEDLLEGQA